MKNEKLEKQASSEIAQSRERFEKWAVNFCADLGLGRRDDGSYWDPRTHFAWESGQAAERDTRERCAQIVENEPLGYITESEHEKLENFADRVAERIRGKE